MRGPTYRSDVDRLPGIRDYIFLFGLYWILNGVLDLDHVVVLIRKDLPITAGNLLTEAGRPSHYLGVIIIWIICFVVYSYLVGFLLLGKGETYEEETIQNEETS